MRFSLAVVALSSALAVSAQTNHLVMVGNQGTLTFSPSSITAAQGDTVSFQFMAKNHSVTQSTFAEPCSRMETPTLGVDSGFVSTPANATQFAQWTITVDNATAPLWFFCAQTTPAVHCHAGMVFAINPTADKTFAAFQASAMGNSTTGTSASGAGATAGATASTSAPVGGATGAAGGSVPATMTSVAANSVSNTVGGTVATLASTASSAAGASKSNAAGKINGASMSGLLALFGLGAVLL